MARRSTLALFAATVVCACFGRPFDPPSLVQTLRIVAIRADHSTPPPGTDAKLEMLTFDGSPKAKRADGSMRSIETIWIGGCFDPPGDLYYQCYPLLDKELAALASGTPSPNLGRGPTFTLHVPSDLVSRRKGSRSGVPPYGLSYVFYAACAGKVVVVPRDPSAPPATPPIACIGPDGSDVDAEGFVFGYLPLYSYPGLDNANPVVTGGTFDARSESPKTCATDADCASGDACGSAKSCIPVVQACDGRVACRSYTVKPMANPADAEPDPLATFRAGAPRTERLYVQYLASHGVLGGDSRSIVDPVHGPRDDYETTWSPPAEIVGETRIWAIVKDSRGGVAWWWQDVVVR